LLRGDQSGALTAWQRLVDLPRLLFAEPSPAPIRRWLWRIGLIDSPEVRLPMTSVTGALAASIEQAIVAAGAPSA
jgi:4-hydroxy-tetrahydrodipicolinate synthase